MKKKNSESSSRRKINFNSYPVENLLDVVPIFLESNLEDPQVEATARDLLAALRKKGCEIQEADLDCEGCAACLHLSLMSALNFLSD